MRTLNAPVAVRARPQVSGRRVTSPRRGSWDLLTSIRHAPVTMAYLLVLIATTTALADAHGRAARWMMAHASTNLHNMASQPIRALVDSVFWLESPWLIWPMAGLLILVMAPAERWLGAPRTLLAFAIGHAGGTVITVGVIAEGIAHGWLPRSLSHAIDIGPSYGLAALAGLLVTRLPRRRSRHLAAALLLGGLGVAVVVGGDFTDAGHLIAAVLGLCVTPVVVGAAPRALPQEADRTNGTADNDHDHEALTRRPPTGSQVVAITSRHRNT